MTSRTKTIPRSAWRTSVLALLGLLATRGAQANGRFPAASFLVVGPGADARMMLLRTTFGLAVSEDYGVSWHWSCEDAYGARGMYDPPLTMGGDGTFVAGVPDGIMVSGTHCAWARPPGDPHVQIMDFANDAAGHTLVAAMGPFTSDNGLSVSSDDGHTWRTGATRPSFFIETVEVAPNAPLRMYVSGYAIGAITLILRSDDGGMSMREVTRDLAGGVDAFIAGVDPTNPDVVWVRSNVELGTYLLRSTDGGAHLTRVFSTTRRMLGFALSDDGQTVWAGSEDPTEGLFRSVRGGPFVRVGPSLGLTCLRYHDGVLFACATEETDGFSLGYSTDGGEHFSPVMSLRDVQAPNCTRGTPVADLCGPLWPAQQMMLTSLDAGLASGRGIDAAVFVHPDVPADIAAEGGADVAMDGSTDAPPSDLGDASGDADAPAADAAPTDAAPTDVPPADVSPADGAQDGAADGTADVNSDAPPFDAASDVVTRLDAPDVRDVAALDTAVPPDVAPVATQPGTCGCRAGTPARFDGLWALAVGGFALRSRARRWRAGSKASAGPARS